jgi:phenylalanyl-tRNA synthetase beta chain
MTISYNWLNEYLPEKIEPEKLSKILTAIGLEVESLEQYESIKGGLKGLVTGQIVNCEQHPNADKLKIVTVDINNGELLQIVCGAPNVAKDQKVVVAPVGITIHPVKGEPILIKVAKIRGVESYGMICAEDEIGIGENHAGIIVLPDTVKVGLPASEYYKPYIDWVYEIGLTPNRMDAMSHLGVAKDVCAYLSYHNGKKYKPKNPFSDTFKPDNNESPVKVKIENTNACQRYSGVTIKDITIAPSPEWLQNKLKAIGQRPINNIVDITNYILHETGQPLHAFDADEINGNEIIVKNLRDGTAFKTLDGNERKLTGEDLMICDTKEGICIAGVFGGIKSGVKETTKNIFLESAWFNPVNIRRTSFYHDLRTEAASRFEKGVDISNTVNVLKHASLLIKEVAGGKIAGEIVDIYPKPKERSQIVLKYSYLKKLSGKNYDHDTIIKILESLGFEVIRETIGELWVAAPYDKQDISLPADVVEEIIRIDGLDNIEIPATISITPAREGMGLKETLLEKLSDYLVGLGFHEILTNSITNSNYYTKQEMNRSVKMINNLSADLDILKPSMLETALESIAYNINRKNNNLRFFEFGKTYSSGTVGAYQEEEHFCVYITGKNHGDSWHEKAKPSDFFMAKGIATSLLNICGLQNIKYSSPTTEKNGSRFAINSGSYTVGALWSISKERLQTFDIKQPVFFIDLIYPVVIDLFENQKVIYKEFGKFPTVQRDLAVIVDKSIPFGNVESAIKKLSLSRLHEIRLFDVFESNKFGERKKSLAINFTFIDDEKTLTDKEIDDMMEKIMQTVEKEFGAEIRKQ